MRWTLILAVLLGLRPEGEAHRLDECLQATRVGIMVNRLEFAVEITPGVEVFAPFMVAVDRNQDDAVSEPEERQYSLRVLEDLVVYLDQQPVELKWTGTTVQPMSTMRQGQGRIRISAAAEVSLLAAGIHELTFTNNHLPGISAYLFNALQPRDPRITIEGQVRDPIQRGCRLEFRVGP